MRFKRTYFVEYNGREIPIKQYCQETGLNYQTVLSRLTVYKVQQRDGEIHLKHGDEILSLPVIKDFQQDPEEYIRLLDLATKKAGSRERLSHDIMIGIGTIARWFSKKSKPGQESIRVIKAYLEENNAGDC